ncbi:MAG: HNH endonuclease [Ardenticatenales bacterium]|nr:HNH endonuclease [Ardenticatenales bacterium]
MVCETSTFINKTSNEYITFLRASRMPSRFGVVARAASTSIVPQRRERDLSTHEDEFESEADFNLYRNRIGGLVLLPRGTNQSYSDQPYSVKLKHYIKNNLLVQSLHPDAYVRNPNFVNVVERRKLPFQSHSDFRRSDLDQRQGLYQRLCEQVWSVERLRHELDM